MDATRENGTADTGDVALQRISEREEVLEFCYWYQGEGFGDRFTLDAIGPFVGKPLEEIGAIMEHLVVEGALLRDGSSYRLSDGGRKAGGRLFHDTFAEFQVGTHGECTAGCCESETECDHDGLRWPSTNSQAQEAAKPPARKFRAT